MIDNQFPLIAVLIIFFFSWSGRFLSEYTDPYRKQILMELYKHYNNVAKVKTKNVANLTKKEKEMQERKYRKKERECLIE